MFPIIQKKCMYNFTIWTPEIGSYYHIRSKMFQHEKNKYPNVWKAQIKIFSLRENYTILQGKIVLTALFKTKFIQQFQRNICSPMLENYPMSYTDSILVKRQPWKSTLTIENLMVNLCRRFIKYRYESKAWSCVA